MTALASATNIDNSSATNIQAREYLTDLDLYLRGLFGADGNLATAKSTLGTLCANYVAKSGSYTIVAADAGKFINFTSGTVTISLTAAATLGAGFSVLVRNETGLDATIDPNSSETINGATTLTLPTSRAMILMCTGSGWYGVGMDSTASNTAPDVSITLGSVIATTSGTSKDFTGIPSTCKRVTVHFKSVTTNALNLGKFYLQLGDSGGIETTGYLGGYSGAGSTSYFGLGYVLIYGKIVLELFEESSNTWILHGSYLTDDSSGVTADLPRVYGTKSLSGALSQLRLTCTQAFTSGSFAVSYES